MKKIVNHVMEKLLRNDYIKSIKDLDKRIYKKNEKL